MKLSNEMNQNLLYFGNEKKTPNSQVLLFLFSFSFRVFVITVLNEKQTKILSNYWFFFNSRNMANFEAFFRPHFQWALALKLLRCDYVGNFTSELDFNTTKSLDIFSIFDLSRKVVTSTSHPAYFIFLFFFKKHFLLMTF